VTVNVEVPKSLNEKQKDLLREFAKACGENNYAKKKSFFKTVLGAGGGFVLGILLAIII
jgi:molecular chaperone DnaJ